MDKIEAKTDSGSPVDVVDPSTPLVTVAMVKGDSHSTALGDERLYQISESEPPVRYRLYRRRWLGVVAIVRAFLCTRGVG
jgi:hypothetical protein